MSPSRGPPTQSTLSSSPTSTTATADQKSDKAINSYKTSLNYLISPSSPARPARLRTRAFLRAVRFIGIFVFWRLVRYAKYLAIGSLVTAVGATALGSVVSGAAVVVAPTGILASAGVGLLWGVGRWGFRRVIRNSEARRKNRSGDVSETDGKEQMEMEDRRVLVGDGPDGFLM
ncbi:hypothetical protein MMC12_007261 [Toensbergia leucococca]|nr:hypothetical protein [Toensbergia leucococca]